MIDFVLVVLAAYVAGFVVMLWDGMRGGILDPWGAAALALIWPLLVCSAAWLRASRMGGNQLRWVGSFDLHNVRKVTFILIASMIAAGLMLLAVIYMVPGRQMDLRGSYVSELGLGGDW